ncbi:MAG: nucleotidyltransferase [Candidatus Amoebophilus sp. 36-38]|nr:MAG: nucleotidyltransferase [Candidatus Amoebophilus sp. 36-38]
MLNLIIPMAGKGKRMLPHTLTTLKPMVPIAGKPIIKRLLEEIRNLYSGPIGHIGFIVKDLQPPIQSQLEEMASIIGAQPHFYEQEEALGTAHAITCANALLQGPVLIAYPDTLFKNLFHLDTSREGIILVNQVEDPAAFGVVQVDSNNLITDFVEKPTTFISDLAIIGLYYFREGENLKHAIEAMINQRICKAGEYQLTSALTHMQQQGVKFYAQEVKEWMDCGNKQATLHTNQRFLDFLQGKEDLIAPTAQIKHSTIVPPVYLGENVIIDHSVIGPYVSISNHTHITDSHVKNSIIQEHAQINQANIQNSMIGNYAYIQGSFQEMSVGDYNTIVL